MPAGYDPPLPNLPFHPQPRDPYGGRLDLAPHAVVTAEIGNGPVRTAPQLGLNASISGQRANGSYVLAGSSTIDGGALPPTAPGPGFIALNLLMQWPAPASGFRAILVDTEDSVGIPVTWMASRLRRPNRGAGGLL